MPPKVRCTAVQKRKLCEYMATHALFANGEYGGPLGARQHETQWQELAESLREFGPQKSVAAWKTTWRDLKRKAREDNAAARRATAVTGNSAVIPPVGEDELLILSAIGVDSSEGVGPPESEIGFNFEPTPPQSTGVSATSSDPFAVPAPAFSPLAPWDVAGPSRASTLLGPALHYAPATHAVPATHAAPATHAVPATHAAATHAVPATHAAATHAVPASSHTTPSPASARTEQNTRTRNRNRMTEPAGFLLLQQEQNNLLKDIRDELRRSNELRERHFEALLVQNRMLASNRHLEDTQLINDESLEDNRIE